MAMLRLRKNLLKIMGHGSLMRKSCQEKPKEFRFLVTFLSGGLLFSW